MKDRIEGANDKTLSLRWRSDAVHTTMMVAESAILVVPFLVAAAAAEWIAAVKIAFTHKFHYEVALKPKLNQMESKLPESDVDSESGGSSEESRGSAWC